MIPEDIAKLKAADIRAELSGRGLPTKGDKAALSKRLTNALQNSNVPTSTRFDPLNPNESVDGSNLNNLSIALFPQTVMLKRRSKSLLFL